MTQHAPFSYLILLSGVVLLAGSALGMSCGPEYRKDCEKVTKIIHAFSALHVQARRGIDADQFKQAGLKLLLHNRIPFPENIPLSFLDQCTGTMSLVHEKTKKSPATISLEFLNFYMRQWDPHSRVLTEKEKSVLSSFRKDYGFNFERFSDSGLIEITDIIAGSPAHTAGLKEGMTVQAIDGRKLQGLSTEEIQKLLHKDELALQVSLNQQSRTVRLRRKEMVEVPAVQRLPDLETDKGVVCVIKLRHFESAYARFSGDLASCAGKIGLVLDLRGNPGGSIDEALQIADLFVPNNSAFVALLSRGGKKNVLSFTELGSIWDEPVVVLIDEGTKSAAEILAGALRDYGALIVGSPSFGKGTRQTTYMLDKFGLPGFVELSTAFTILPSGDPIQGTGILPQICVSGCDVSKRSGKKRLPAPKNQSALSGYDADILPSASETFRENLASIESHFQDPANQQTPSKNGFLFEAASEAVLLLRESMGR